MLADRFAFSSGATMNVAVRVLLAGPREMNARPAERVGETSVAVLEHFLHFGAGK
jgi:hypothetical protein